MSRRDSRSKTSPDNQAQELLAKKAQPERDATQDLVGNQATQLLNQEPELAVEEQAKKADAPAVEEEAALDRRRAGQGRSSLKKSPSAGGLDLNSEKGVETFAKTLGLPSQQTRKICEFLNDMVIRNAREMAQMLQMLTMGELGIRRIERLILADDDISTRQVWDEDPQVMCLCPDFGDQLQLVGSGFDKVAKLMRLFPRACQRVRYLMLGNFEGRETEIAEYDLLFPNAIRIEGWQNDTPGNWRNAINHMKTWEGRNSDDDDDGEEQEAS